LIDFSSLGLSGSLLKVLPELNITVPTPIQQQAIPILTGGTTDFLGLAQTGTGKTAAFGLPLLDSIEPGTRTIQALVLAPTRELAQQINQQFTSYAKYLSGVSSQVVFGGANIVTQIKALKKAPDILVATPGRLLDLIRRKALYLDDVKTVVLDEADEMLNMGFREDIQSILDLVASDKSIWLFSATLSGEIRQIVNTYLKNPAEVMVNPRNSVNENIVHQFIPVNASEKKQLLKVLLEVNSGQRGIIFCRTKKDTQDLAQQLATEGYPVEALHGDLTQAQRDQVMGKFKSARLHWIVATDVAARGIDVSNLEHIIHFNLPDDFEYYTHRSGRTARAGSSGNSLVMVTRQEISKMKVMERKLKIRFEKYEIPPMDEIYNQRLLIWAEKLAKTEANSAPQKLMQEIEMLFEGMNKREILEKLVAQQLQTGNSMISSITVSKSDDRREDRKDDRREDRKKSRSKDKVKEKVDEFSGKRKSEGSESAKPGRSKEKVKEKVEEFSGKRNSESLESAKPGRKEEMQRYYMNVGRMDGIDEPEFAEFVIETARIKPEDLGTIILEDKHAFFYIRKQRGPKVTDAFRGMLLEGRPLRVNRDDQPKKK
jgi:ATP-dependent RNA helicase DeaD